MLKTLVLCLLLLTIAPTWAKPGSARSSSSLRGSSGGSHKGGPYTKPKARRSASATARRTPSSRAIKCAACTRTGTGKIRRSAQARRSFERTHPCPSTGKTSGACPGYVVDHVIPLKRGGPDAPRNMQWQTTAAAKAKDRVE